MQISIFFSQEESVEEIRNVSLFRRQQRVGAMHDLLCALKAGRHLKIICIYVLRFGAELDQLDPMILGSVLNTRLAKY